MQSALILLSAWLGHAVGAHAPLWAWFFAWPLAKAAGMLPVTLGGLGVRDAALATLLVPFGVPAAFGVVASLVWNAVVIGGALVGGALWWIIRPGRRRVSAPDAATTAANSTPTANGTANATATGYAAATTAAGPRTVGASRPARSRLASAPGQAWTRYGGAFLWLVVAHAVVTAVLRLVPAFDALMHDPGAAIDVVIRYGEVLRWFDGQPIYAEATSADYPPASYVLLWPLIGWLAQGPMLVFYAVGLAATMAALGAMAVRASGATARSEKAFMAVFVLPLGATQIVVWIGQLGLHVTAAALGAAMILLGSGLVDRRARSLAADAAAAALLAFSLVKPTFAVPLVAGVLIVSGRMRPAVLTGAIYAGLTFLAAAFQERSAVGLAIDWLGREGILDVHLGSMNVYLWLHWMGFEGSMLPVSLLVLAVFLVWAWRHRRTAPLQVLGVSVIVSRLWVHHRVHDDVVLLILAIVLFRAAKERTGSEGAHPMLAAVLLAGAYGLGHAPWAYLSRGSPSLFFIVESGRTAVWLTALGLLVWQAVVHSRRRAEAAAS
jgi:hypothetical protein